jgi:dipeptidyl aminopeptidase/acylaminoacyl peptidase
MSRSLLLAFVLAVGLAMPAVAQTREDIEFKTQDGVTLKGWYYLPDQRSGKVPTIVMAHGFSAVKEMYLDKFAETFAKGGLGVLVFDNRNFGASGGEPRQEIDPWQQVRD